MNKKNNAQEDLRIIHENVAPWDWPADTGSLIQTVLDDRSADLEVRIAAAGMAGDTVMMNDGFGRKLLTLLRDSDEPDELRAKAAIAFGAAFEYGDLYEFDDPDDILLSEEFYREAQDGFKKAYHDAGVPKIVRRRILEASARAPQEWQSKAIRAAYAADDRDWRITALFCMGYIQGFDQEIIDSLESDDKDVSYEALGAAGYRGLKKAWPVVARILADGNADKAVLLTAIEASGNMNQPEAAGLLAELAVSDDEDIADAASEAMIMRGAGGLNFDFDNEDDW